MLTSVPEEEFHSILVDSDMANHLVFVKLYSCIWGDLVVALENPEVSVFFGEELG